MPTIYITTKKSVTLENSEHDPITYDGLHELLSTAADLNIPGDTVVEFTLDDNPLDDNFVVVTSVSITENVTEAK